MIFGAGMTGTINCVISEGPPLRRPGGSASPRTMLSLAPEAHYFDNALGDRVPPRCVASSVVSVGADLQRVRKSRPWQPRRPGSRPWEERRPRNRSSASALEYASTSDPPVLFWCDAICVREVLRRAPPQEDATRHASNTMFVYLPDRWSNAGRRLS